MVISSKRGKKTGRIGVVEWGWRSLYFLQVNKFKEETYFSVAFPSTVSAKKISYSKKIITKHDVYWVHHEEIFKENYRFIFFK